MCIQCGGDFVTKSSTIHIRIEPEIKKHVENTLSKLGLSTSEAVNIFLRQVIITGSIPFEIKIPNYNLLTEKAMEEAKNIKEKKVFSNVDDLFDDLNK